MSNVTRFAPEVLKENDTMVSIYEVQGEEVNDLNSHIDEIFNNNFIKNCNLEGVKKYEDILEIKADVSFDLEYRKLKVFDKLTYRPPFTRQRLQQILERIMGIGNFIFDIDYDLYEIVIDIETDNTPYYMEFSKLIRNVVPANMYLILSLPYSYMYLKKMYTYERMGDELTYEELSKYSTEGLNEIYN